MTHLFHVRLKCNQNKVEDRRIELLGVQVKSPSAPPKDSVYEEARGKEPVVEAQVHLKKLSDYKTFSKVACRVEVLVLQ